MNIFDMSISSVLDALSYGLVLVYGLVLAAAIAGSFETARQRRIVLWLCPVFLLVQLLGRGACPSSAPAWRICAANCRTGAG